MVISRRSLLLAGAAFPTAAYGQCVTDAPEESRTNIVLNSNNFTAGGWGAPVAVTLTPGQAGAPDGTATFTRMTETTANSAHYLGQALAGLTASATYTLSVYARMEQIRYFQLSFRDTGSNGSHATFDLQTGSISGANTADGTGVVGTASIQAISGGTYRCGITTGIGALTTGTLYLFCSNAPNSGWAPSYVGNASNGLLIFGAQAELGAFQTSYIPTTSVPVTRPLGPAVMSPTQKCRR